MLGKLNNKLISGIQFRWTYVMYDVSSTQGRRTRVFYYTSNNIYKRCPFLQIIPKTRLDLIFLNSKKNRKIKMLHGKTVFTVLIENIQVLLK